MVFGLIQFNCGQRVNDVLAMEPGLSSSSRRRVCRSNDFDKHKVQVFPREKRKTGMKINENFALQLQFGWGCLLSLAAS